MKIPLLAAPVFFLIGIAGQLVADTITLKGGKTLEGKVVRTEGDVYVIEYQYSARIKDIKKVPKKDVVSIVTEKLDAKAFEAISKLTPTPDLLTAEDYKQRIRDVKAFIAKFPDSAMLKDANAILKELTKELSLIEAGGRKLQGIFISGADCRANSFDLDARVLEAKIQEAVKNSQWLLALRVFVDLDKDYQSALCYREVLPVVVKALQAFRSQVSSSLASFDARMEKQTADLQNMTPRDSGNSKRELASQDARLEALYKKEKAAMQVWVTPNAAHKQSLEDNTSFADSELQRLKEVLKEQGPAKDGGKVFRNAWKIIHSDADAETVEKALAEAEAASLPERYLKMLQAEAKAAGAKPSGK